MFRSLLIEAIGLWGNLGVAPGWRYQFIEKHAPWLCRGFVRPRRLPNGCVMDCDLADHVPRHVYFWGVYEPAESFVFCNLLRPGMNVVDAGANVGQYSILAARAVGPAGAVFAFEPVPRNWNRAAENFRNNRLANVKLFPNALWRCEETVDMGRERDFADNDGSFGIGATGESGEAPRLQVLAKTLDRALEEVGSPAIQLIKMDVEGAELFALQGAAKTLATHRPAILIELNERACARLNYRCSEIAAYLTREFGYLAWKFADDNSGLIPADGGADVRQANYLFTTEALPARLLKFPHFKSILRWARSGSR